MRKIKASCRLYKRKEALTKMHNTGISMHMRTTINIDDDLIARAAELTGVKEKTALVRLGLEYLIARESAKRLARLGGTEKDLQPIPRRKSNW
jgi:Arc/MetJ family transcription regulator